MMDSITSRRRHHHHNYHLQLFHQDWVDYGARCYENLKSFAIIC